MGVTSVGLHPSTKVVELFEVNADPGVVDTVVDGPRLVVGWEAEGIEEMYASTVAAAITARMDAARTDFRGGTELDEPQSQK